ncbi:hypothetical protein DMB66_13885 [Actinoplanes sp. ATCC 53533]|nr:hypothetical protein DMB66_13885 [Actinoplanes sp. ATCC 53533]
MITPVRQAGLGKACRMRYRCTVVGVASAAALGLGAIPAAASPAVPEPAPRVADATAVAATLTLTPARPVEPAATAVSDPANPDFRRFLSPVAVRDRFGAPPARVARVTRWARGAGFAVGRIDATGSRLPITGTAAAARREFGVDLVEATVSGVRVRSASPVRVPAVVAADVLAVTGLSQPVAEPLSLRSCLASPNTSSVLAAAAPLVTAGGCASLPSVVGAVGGVSCALAWGEQPGPAPLSRALPGRVSQPLCGYTGPQLRTLYGLAAADTGAGQTVVIVGAFNGSSTLVDANRTFALTGVAPLPAGRYQVRRYPAAGTARVTGCDRAGWALQQATAVQVVHTLAPAARIVYVAAPDCTRLVDALAGVVADPGLVGAVVSLGWGVPAETVADDDRAATDAVLARAALRGMSTFSASGIYGTAAPAGTWRSTVAYPASSPFTTAVGGTTSAVGAGEAVLWQTGWGSVVGDRHQVGRRDLAPVELGGLVPFGRRDFIPDGRRVVVLAAVGGGPSLDVARPAWQTGVVGGYRQVPDVAALADPLAGLRVGLTDGGYLVRPTGGTGLATPIVAALTALAQARTATRAGLLAPLLYARTAAGRPPLDDVRHITAAVWIPQPRGGLVVAVDAARQRTRPGWDPVTGLGTPGAGFLSALD